MANKFGTPTLTLEHVRTLPMFGKLSLQQRRYVLSIVAGASAPVAYAAAYDADSLTAAKACHTPMRSRKVQRILSVAFGVELGRA
jgi:hypothetical protein